MKHASVDRAKRVSNQCRNHGSCPYCERSRTRGAAKVDAEAHEQMAGYVGTMHARGRHLDFHMVPPDERGALEASRAADFARQYEADNSKNNGPG